MSFRRTNWSVRFLLGVAAALFVLGSALPAAAQDYRGKVSGTVTDVNTAAIPGARVLLHNDAVVQGLGERRRMRKFERWGVLTIGTGLGNACYTNTAA